MAMKICNDPEDVQKAKQWRDHAATVSEYRKALSVILVAEYGFDAERTASILLGPCPSLAGGRPGLDQRVPLRIPRFSTEDGSLDFMTTEKPYNQVFPSDEGPDQMAEDLLPVDGQQIDFGVSWHNAGL